MDRPTPYPRPKGIPPELLEEAIRAARSPTPGGVRRRLATLLTSAAFQLSLAIVGYATIRCLAPSLSATGPAGRQPIAMPVVTDANGPAGDAHERARIAPDAGLIQLAGAPAVAPD